MRGNKIFTGIPPVLRSIIMWIRGSIDKDNLWYTLYPCFLETRSIITIKGINIMKEWRRPLCSEGKKTSISGNVDRMIATRKSLPLLLFQVRGVIMPIKQ